MSSPGVIVSSDVGWAIGTSLAISAQFVGNLGTVLQRRSHIDSGTSPVLHRPLWLFGLALIITASISDFAALNFTTQSMLGGLGSLTLVANTIFAPLIASERLTWVHVLATMLIVLGCSIVVAYGPHSADLYSPAQLFRLLASPGFILFCLIIIAAGVSLHLLLESIGSKVETILRTDAEVADAKATAARRRARAKGRRKGSQPPYVVTESRIALDYSKAPNPWASYHIHRSGFAVMSAIFGSANVLFGKILSQIMTSAVFSSTTAFYADARLSSTLAVVTLFCVILIVVGAVGQMKYINDATQRFEALLVQPIYQASWTLLSVAGGMVVQREWTLFVDAGRAFLFFLGISLTVGGAFMLSQVRASGDDSSRAERRAASRFGVDAGAMRGAGATPADERDERQRQSLLAGKGRAESGDREDGLTLLGDEDDQEDGTHAAARRCAGDESGRVWERERALTGSLDGRASSGSTGET